MNSYQLTLITFLNLFLAGNSLCQVTSQTNCKAIESENEQLTSSLNEKEQVITELNSQVVKFENDIQYLKESLDLVNSKESVESDDIVFRITSVVGKSDQEKIVVEGLVENHGAVRRLQADGDVYVVDPKGNRFKYDYRGTNFGGESAIAELQKDIPIKMTIEFKDVIEQTPTLKALVLSFHRLDDAIFKNLDVKWE